jgi:O-antigen/teichoic acid export membrane protein
VRDLVNHPHQRDVYLGTAFWLKFVGAFVMLGVVALATLFTSNDHTTNLYVFIIASGIIFQSFEVVDFYFQSKVLSKFVSICKITQLAVSSALKVYFVLTGADLIWFVVVTLADQFLLALTLFIAYRYQKLGSFYQYFDITLAKKLLKNSWPLILSGLAVALYMRIDQIMIKEMLGDKEAGIYSAAVRLSEVWYFIPVIITSSLFPAIVSAKKISEELYYTRLQSLYTLMVWIAIGIALPMTFLCGWLVALLYGEAYAGAAQVLMIHIWAGIFVFLGVASGSWFNNENLQQYSFYRTVLGALINIGLNLALIPRFGVVGAAIATVIAQSIAALFFDLYTTKTRIAFFMKIKTVYFAGLIKGK